MKQIKIGLIGAGKRVHEMYGPIFHHLKEKYNIVGFYNNNQERTNKVIEKFNFKHYKNLSELEKDVDVFCLVVNSNVNTTALFNLLNNYNKPVFVETPVWTKEVVEKARQKNISVAVAEQTPYLPIEQFKNLLLKNSNIGKVSVVQNDFRTFEYHGLAQLRRYIGYDKTPVEVCGMTHSIDLPEFLDGNNKLQKHNENWDVGQIRFNTGELAIYNYSSMYTRCGFRLPKSMRIYTDRATISNDDNNINIKVLNNKKTHDIKVDVEIENGNTKKISCDLFGETIEWNKKHSSLNDQQEAIEFLLDNFQNHVMNGEKLIYDVQQGWTDFNLLMAIRHSSSNRMFIRR